MFSVAEQEVVSLLRSNHLKIPIKWRKVNEIRLSNKYLGWSYW